MSNLEEFNKLYTNLRKSDNPVVVGIDEAGRGPVIGPMVYGIYVSELSGNTNYKDSKMLTPTQREMFYKGMIENIKNGENSSGIVGIGYYKIHPVYITSHMEGRSKNLNEIAKEAVVKLLNEVEKNYKNVATVYIDGLGDNKKYEEYLKRFFRYKFIIENKADSKYQVVSGASIVAKVSRDREVEKYNCGSGYPSDPITIKWLNENGQGWKGYPDFVRHSWKTIKNKIGEKKDLEFKKDLEGFYRGPS